MATVIHPSFRIGDWIVRPGRDCIERDGKTVHVAPKAMAVLECLARARGKVVPRQALFEQVWPHCDVTDDALTQRIVELRRALGDSARDPAIIETIPKIGFRLIPRVRPMAPEPGSEPVGVAPRNSVARSFAWLAASLAALLLLALAYDFLADRDGVVAGNAADTGLNPGDATIAVLPLEWSGTNDRYLELANAMHDEILTRLTRIPSIRVISHYSAEKFRDSDRPLREIGEKLGVANLLTGSLRSNGSQLLVHIQLVDAHSEEYLWAESFDRELTAENFFAVQSEIALDVATALSASLSPRERARVSEVPTTNFEAYRTLLQGRFALEERSTASFHAALTHYERALELNPEFAQAHIAIAGAYSTALEDRGLAQSEAWAKIEEHSWRALQLDPLSGHAYKFLAQVRRAQGRYEEAEALSRKAYELDPGNVFVLHNLGLTLRLRGRAAEAVPYYDRALQLDPLSPIINESRGSLLRDLGRFEAAEKQYIDALEIDPGFPYTHWAYGLLDWSLGAPGSALARFEQADRLAPESDVFRTWAALMHLELGQDARARELLDDALARTASGPDNDAVIVEELYRLYHRQDLADLADGRRFLQRGMYGALVDLPPRSLLNGNYREAIADYEQIQPRLASGEVLIDGSNYRAAIYLAFALAQLGERRRALALLDRAEPVVSGLQRLGLHGYWVSDAQIQVIRGDPAGGAARMEAAVAEGWRNLWRFYFYHDPVLEPLRADREFRAVAQRLEQERSLRGEATRHPALTGPGR